jgi:excinuclease ABC subunit C
LKIIQKARDEAHRFGISFHRKTRIINTLQTELQQIPGIGNKSVLLLLKHFKSVKRIKQASLDELEKIIGKHKAKIIYNEFEKQK